MVDPLAVPGSPVLGSPAIGSTIRVTVPPRCSCLKVFQRDSCKTCSDTGQVRLTFNTYSHVMPAMLREAAETRGRALS